MNQCHSGSKFFCFSLSSFTFPFICFAVSIFFIYFARRMKRISFIIIFSCLCVMTVMAQRADYGKMSSLVRRAAMEQKDTRRLAPSRNHHSSSSICAFVKINQDADLVLQENHCLKLAQFGKIYIASIPLSRLASLSMNKHVTRIEAGQRGTALMDTTHIIQRIDPLYEGTNLPQAYTGKGVIMGVF